MSTYPGQIRREHLDTFKNRKPKWRPKDYVDPPEVLALQAEYIRRAKERGRIITARFAGAMLGTARNVYEHPERYNRKYTANMVRAKRMRMVNRNPKRGEWTRKGLARARVAVTLKTEQRALERAQETNPLAIPERISRGRFLPLG